MRIHYLQHVSYEGLGAIETLIKGHEITATKFFEGDNLPDINNIDVLIVMGGPMGVMDHREYPWLEAEIAFIKRAIELKKGVLGICLGAQLIAHVLGAKVYKNSEKEIGWFDIEPSKALIDSKYKHFLDENTKVFHWHGDTFDLPQNAILLGSSESCKNQGFIYEDHVIGLQFHLEMTAEGIKDIVNNGRDELVDGPYIQSDVEILRQKEYFEVNLEYLREIIQYITYGIKHQENNITLREVKKYFLSFNGAYEDYPFDNVTPVYKVNKKMFALINFGAEHLRINLKCNPDDALLLRDKHPAIIPGYHMNKKHWNTLILDGSLDHDMVFNLIEHSFNLVSKKK